MSSTPVPPEAALASVCVSRGSPSRHCVSLAEFPTEFVDFGYVPWPWRCRDGFVLSGNVMDRGVAGRDTDFAEQGFQAAAASFRR